MAGIGEASAIVTLIGIAPQISKAVISAASNYKSATAQIESFGREVSMLGEILGQLRNVLFVTDDNDSDKSGNLEPGVKTLLSQILEECNEMFSQLNGFSDRLHAKPNALQSVNRRGKMKWVLGDKTELEYLRARVDSMKINILLMMTLQSVQNQKSSDAKAEENAKRIVKLSQENEACIKRLQMLENEGAHVEDHIWGKISTSMSVVSAETVGTAGSVQSSSTWSSIFRAYGWKTQKDKKPLNENAKSRFGVLKEQELLCGIGGHALLQVRDPKAEDGQLEKLDLVPSILDGDTKVPAWLAQDSLPAFFTSRVRHRLDDKSEKAKALIAVVEEEMKKDELETGGEMETEDEMGSEDETKSEILERKLIQDPEVLIWHRTCTL